MYIIVAAIESELCCCLLSRFGFVNLLDIRFQTKILVFSKL